jgi:hypothetical protein
MSSHLQQYAYDIHLCVIETSGCLETHLLCCIRSTYRYREIGEDSLVAHTYVWPSRLSKQRLRQCLLVDERRAFEDYNVGASWMWDEAARF